VLIGVEDDAEGRARLAAFRKGMHDLGWSEGRDMQMDVRFASGDADRGAGLWRRIDRMGTGRNSRQ